MGWVEFRAWLRELRRLTEPERPDPDRWTQGSEDNFVDLRAERERRRGR